MRIDGMLENENFFPLLLSTQKERDFGNSS